MKINLKNKVVVVIIALIMLFPSVVAIINYNMMQGGAAESYNTVSVRLQDHVSNVYLFERDSKNSDMLEYFIKTIANATEVEAIPDSIEQSDYYTVTVKTTVDEFLYKFYFTTSADDCFFLSGGDGKTHKINPEDAEKFITSPYANCLYENGTAPSLLLSGQHVYPDSASWSFKNADGEYTSCDCSVLVKDEVEFATLEGGLSMTFSLEPDIIEYTITDKNTSEIYHDLTTIPVEKDMDVSIVATAKWYEDEARTYYGEQTYKFDAVFGVPARFYAGATQKNDYGEGITEIQVGEFIIVTAYNVKETSNITFQSQPEINYTPTFFNDEEIGGAIAVIPFSYNLSEGDYELTFTYGGTTETIKVAVKARGTYNRYHVFDEKEITIDQNIISTLGGEEIRKKAEDTLREVAKKESTSKRYWTNGETLYYDDGPESVLDYRIGYGFTIKVKDTDISYINNGVDFSVATGTEIGANLAGEIIYAGYLDYCGYTVVIDHGCGLKSWYAHLGSVSVNVGDVVKKGQTIGTSVPKDGSAVSFTDSNGIHIGMTVYDIPICTYAIWNNSYRAEGMKGLVFYEEK